MFVADASSGVSQYLEKFTAAQDRKKDGRTPSSFRRRDHRQQNDVANKGFA
jgi:hypothetical protein